jgi:hypothetical protein
MPAVQAPELTAQFYKIPRRLLMRMAAILLAWLNEAARNKKEAAQEGVCFSSPAELAHSCVSGWRVSGAPRSPPAGGLPALARLIVDAPWRPFSQRAALPASTLFG